MKLFPVYVLFFLLAGCQTTRQQQITPTSQSVTNTTPVAEVVHISRYTLVDITPADALRSPLRQIATRTLPAPKKNHPMLTRGDAMHAWLHDTGYGLCLPIAGDASQLFNSPLPEIQRSMGPMRIDAALQVLAGSAWTMTVDEVSRTICWLRTPASQTLS